MLSVPLFAVSVKLRVTEAAPAAKVGAVNVVLDSVGVASVTAGPAVCARASAAEPGDSSR